MFAQKVLVTYCKISNSSLILNKSEQMSFLNTIQGLVSHIYFQTTIFITLFFFAFSFK